MSFPNTSGSGEPDRIRCITEFVRGQAPQNSKLAEYHGVCPPDFAPPILSFAVPAPYRWNGCFAPERIWVQLVCTG